MSGRGVALRGNLGTRRLSMVIDDAAVRVELIECAIDGLVIVKSEGEFGFAEFARDVAYLLSDQGVAPAGLRDVIRQAYAHAGDAVFSAKLRGETLDLYDVIAEAICDRYVIIEKEST